MSNFTSQSSLLNLAPKAEVKGVQLASSQASDDAPSFLASLVQALDESTGILPDSLQMAEKELMQEFMLTNNNLLGGFSEEQKTLIFDSLSFMEVLGVLENLQINASDVKLSSLLPQTQNFVQTQSNLDALKGAKNLNELLQIAKNLGLEVSNVKIEQIFELKSTFPNLNKANFFSADTKAEGKSAFKEFLNTKIESILKESENKFSAKHATHKSQSPTNLLSKALQTLANDDEGDILLKNELKNAVQKSLESLAKSEEVAFKSEKPTPQMTKAEKIAPLSEKVGKIQVNNEKQEVLNTEPKANTTPQKAVLKAENSSQMPFKEVLKSVVLDDEVQNTPQKETKATQSTQTPLNASNAEQTNTQSKVLSSVASSLNSSENIPTLKKELKKDEKESKINNKEVQKEPKNAGEKLSVKIDEKIAKNEKSVDEKNAPKQNEPKAEFRATNEPKTTAPQLKDTNSTLQSKNAPIKESANKEFKVEFSIKDSKDSTATLPNTENKPSANALNLDNVPNKIQSKLSDFTQVANSTFSKVKENADNKSVDDINSNFSVNSDNAELNSLIKDLSQVSRNELKSEVNIKETFSRFVQDFKEQIQHYKPPFTRFNITLNPANLGEVEVTLIQRGSNLHINFNSTTSTMNLFIQNQAEFKNSLVNMGFTGLEMNFSDQSKKDKQQQGKNRSAYGFKDEFNTNESNTLEVILARYF